MKKNFKMALFVTTTSVVFSGMFSLKAYSAEAENLKGFDAKSDLRIGPILSVGYPISVNSPNVSYNPIISLNLHGESFNLGSAKFEFSWISLNRSFAKLEAGKTFKFSDVSPGSQISKISKNLLLITLSSPIGYNPGDNFEFGWLGGIFNQFISADKNLPGDGGNNLGINGGIYLKSYQFYPFVPYANGKFIFGNMYDNGKTLQEGGSQKSSLKAGYFISGGFDFYITRRIILSLGYNLNNPDFYTLSPTKATVVQPGVVQPGQVAPVTSTGPTDDPSISMDENMQSVSASFGFLF